MAYYKTTVKTGPITEVIKTICYTRVKGQKRNAKTNKTIQRIADVNQKNAERRLRWKLQSNFTSDDIFVTLTYGTMKPEKDEAKKLFNNFLRRMKNEYKKQGKEFKYIAVTEWEGKRIHHHIVMNEIDIKIIKKQWGLGRPHIENLDNAESGYDRLAAYLIKETSRTFKEDQEHKQRWQCSRNLKAYDNYKRERVSANEWRSDPRAIKGYILDKSSIVNGAWTIGSVYFETQEYRMIEVNHGKETRRAREDIVL